MESSFYYALSHEIRRKILKIIGDNEFSSFTNLKRILKVSTGTIYHHLDSLSQLIQQKKNKKYYLTDLGIHAYNSLKENIEIMESIDFSNREYGSPLIKFLFALTPIKFFSFKDKDKTYNIIISMVVLIIGTILCGLNGFFSFLLFFIKTPENIYQLSLISHLFLGVFFILNFLIYFFLVEVCCRIFYRKKDNTLNFFLSFPVILYPMVIYLFIHFILLSTELIQISVISFIDTVFLIFFQILSLWLLTYNLKVTKGLKIERGLIIALLLHYGSFTIVLFLSI
ncbi:MAG: hypothetical protein EU532_03230 [Promethearchaeota archaeon]|nr:MAG: hypothetical protein EU532_03230 [Candidatus Lokiarchaeota archaeon]